MQNLLKQEFFYISKLLLQLIGSEFDREFVFSDVTVVDGLNLLDQVLYKLTLLITIIELSQVGMGTQDKVFQSPNFESLYVVVASLDKFLIEHSQLRFVLLLRCLNQHFLELDLDIVDCSKGRLLCYQPCNHLLLCLLFYEPIVKQP